MSYKKDNKVIGMTSPAMETSIDGKGMRIVVGVFQYKDEAPKIGINRAILNGGEPRPAKLGRLTVEEADHIARYLPEAVRELRKF